MRERTLKLLPTFALWIAVLCLCVAWSLSALGQVQPDDVPRVLEGVDIIEHLDDPLPLDLEFTNEHGDTVKLGDYFQQDRPVIITLNYYRCPMLCTLQLNGMVKGLKDLKWKPGKEFQIVTISIAPDETYELASAKKSAYVKSYTPEAEDGWAFLTGSAENSRSVADAIGFGYYWNEDKQEWAHAAAIFVSTPDGRISRYLYGTDYFADDLKLSLLEASEGRIGNTVDRFIMWCFHYDDTTGQYTVAVMNIMRLLGFITVIVLAVGLLIMWKRDVDKQRAEAEQLGLANGGGIR